MKRLILSLTVILPLSAIVHTSLRAQSITPQVVASSGAHAATPNAQLSWTLGEVAVTTLSGGGNTLTQGFHQTYDISTLVEESPEGMTVTVFPNPATDMVSISLSGVFPELLVSLHDMGGKLVHDSRSQEGQALIHLPTGSLATGTYLLRLQSADSTVGHAYRIIKQ